MASGLGALSNSISNFVTGVGAELGIVSGNSGSLYPTSDGIPDHLASFNIENWNKLPFPYTFDVVNTDPSSGGSTAFGWKPFALPLAPTKMSLSEKPSISIKKVQGGTVVSHSGNKYKKLTIEGTTGVNPFRGMTGVDSTTGRAIAKPKELKFMSGYEVANEFKNYLRAYYQYKFNGQKKGDSSITAQLIFKNFKDGEFYIIEIVDSTWDRSADRSFMYDYKIECAVLGLYKFKAKGLDFFDSLDKKINSVVSKIDVARGVLLGAQEILRQVEASYESTVLEPMRKIGLAAKAFAGLQTTAADIGNRIIKNTATAADSLNILKVIKDQKKLARTGEDATIPQSIQNQELPVDLEQAVANQGTQIIVDLSETLYDLPLQAMPKKTQDAMTGETQAALRNPRSFYEDAIVNLERIKANAEDKFNLGSDTYDTLFDRTATVVGDTGKVVTAQEYEVLGAFNEAITAINTLIAYPNLFKSEFNARIDDLNAQFNNTLSIRGSAASKQIILSANVDLERIALDELGNPTRWVEIAELNDLNYPYIIQDLTDTRSNIKKPGDKLLIPQNIVFGLSDVSNIKEIPSLRGLSETEKSFGTDLKVTATMDLDLANNGDLAVVSGIENVAQAIILKIGYERGELKNHPELGVGVMVGQKFLSLEQIRDNLIATLTADQRIEGLSNVALLREGPALYMSFDVTLKLVDTPIPLRIRL